MLSTRPTRRQLLVAAACTAGVLTVADALFHPRSKKGAEINTTVITDTQIAEGFAKVDFYRSSSGALNRCVITVERPCAIVDAVGPGRKALNMRGDRLARVLFEAKDGSLTETIDFPTDGPATMQACVHLTTFRTGTGFVGCFIKEGEGAFIPEKTLSPATRPDQGPHVPPAAERSRV